MSFAAFRDRPLSKNVYSVWRLDAATADIARGLVDKAIDAETHGLKGTLVSICSTARRVHMGILKHSPEIGTFTKRPSSPKKPASLSLKTTRIPNSARLHRPVATARLCTPAGIACNITTTRSPGFQARSVSTLIALATNPRTNNNWSGAALQKGITVTGGAVTEPYLEGLIHPDEFFRFLFEGSNVGDAALRSTRWLKWMIINMGDPLTVPFRMAPVRMAQLFTVKRGLLYFRQW